jgi:hypothetical protein
LTAEVLKEAEVEEEQSKGAMQQQAHAQMGFLQARLEEEKEQFHSPNPPESLQRHPPRQSRAG